MVGILSSCGEVQNGYRRVRLRMRSIERSWRQILIQDPTTKAALLYRMDKKSEKSGYWLLDGIFAFFQENYLLRRSKKFLIEDRVGMNKITL